MSLELIMEQAKANVWEAEHGDRELHLGTAVWLYGRVIKYNPKYHDAYKERGFVYVKLQNYEDAIKDFSKAIRLKKDDANSYCNRGYAYLKAKKYASAIKDFNKAGELNRQRVIYFIADNELIQKTVDDIFYKAGRNLKIQLRKFAEDMKSNAKGDRFDDLTELLSLCLRFVSRTSK